MNRTLPLGKMGLDSGDTEAGMAWRVSTRSMRSSGRKESQLSHFHMWGAHDRVKPRGKEEAVLERDSSMETTQELGL